MKARWIWISTATLMLGIAGASGQELANPKFVVTGPEAKSLGELGQINGDTAQAIAMACEKLAIARNTAVAITVLENLGNVVHEQRMDAASDRTLVLSSERKAKTALMTRRPSSLRQYAGDASGHMFGRDFSMGYFPVAGGLPIWSNDQIIGYIGVSGITPTADWTDEICAHQATTQVVGPQPALPPRPAARTAQ